jgi:hypothetical protein
MRIFWTRLSLMENIEQRDHEWGETTFGTAYVCLWEGISSPSITEIWGE